jgi:hypothetical protein
MPRVQAMWEMWSEGNKRHKMRYIVTSLIWHSHEQTGARLSNSSYTDEFLQVYIYLYFGSTTNQRSVPFGYLIQHLVQLC